MNVRHDTRHRMHPPRPQHRDDPWREQRTLRRHAQEDGEIIAAAHDRARRRRQAIERAARRAFP